MEQFKDGDIVVFNGDSITHNGKYIAIIKETYRRLFPNRNIEFYNAGVAGGSAWNTGVTWADSDVLIHHPNIVVIMFGMNDCARDKLENNDTSALKEAYERFKDKLNEVVSKYVDKGIKVILCTPTPYDEFTPSEISPLPGGKALLAKYASYVREYASKRNIEVVDYNKEMDDLENKGLVGIDHVHPTDAGHLFMARCFLKQQGLNAEDDSLSKEVQSWYDKVAIERNLKATEFLVIGFGVTELKEKIQICKDFEKTRKDEPADEYLSFLVDGYLKYYEGK